ncbi:hypothetical protein [Thermofilum sp.]|uniref:hypothetical protein n=1 Tax=Thermofilum sp. TaxID=1961369 RepID=UPI00319E706C
MGSFPSPSIFEEQPVLIQERAVSLPNVLKTNSAISHCGKPKRESRSPPRYTLDLVVFDPVPLSQVKLQQPSKVAARRRRYPSLSL